MANNIKRFGWNPDRPDLRDFKYAPSPDALVDLPPAVDLRSSGFNPPIWDQGNLGSCTGHGVARCVQFVRRLEGLEDFQPSRLFIYYFERLMEGTVNVDSGAQIRDGIKAVTQYGVPPEGLWPYSDADPGPFQQRPSDEALAEASKHACVKYLSIERDLLHMRACLAAGYPFTFGFSVYTSFQSIGADGLMPVPATGEDMQGGHCVCAVGYDDARQIFILANSWGETWGDRGYFYMPYQFIADHDQATDFWTIRSGQ